MPIRKKASERRDNTGTKIGPFVLRQGKKFAPFVFFEGTFREVERVTSQPRIRKAYEHSIAKAFTDLGFKLLDPQKAVTDAINAINRLKEPKKMKVIFSVETVQGFAHLQAIKFPKTGKILIRQQPLIHGITARTYRPEHTGTSFEQLLKLLKKPFFSRGVADYPATYENVYLLMKRRGIGWAAEVTKRGITFGDRYTIETLALTKKPSEMSSPEREKEVYGDQETHGVSIGHPTQIVRVIVHIGEPNMGKYPKKTREQVIKEKIKYYRKKLKGWPIDILLPKETKQVNAT